ncbi:PEPxxWA-CTERM sorting domain-containing protein [Sphingomonas sp. RS6]
MSGIASTADRGRALEPIALPWQACPARAPEIPDGDSNHLSQPRIRLACINATQRTDRRHVAGAFPIRHLPDHKFEDQIRSKQVGIKIKLAAAAIALAIPSAADASTIISSKCFSVASSAGCLFSGNINGNDNVNNKSSYKNAERAYNSYNNYRWWAGPDIELNYLFDTSTTAGLITGANKSSGTWSTPGYLIDFIAVKAGNYFTLYKIDPASSGSWDTFDIPSNDCDPTKLSHIVFFGSQDAGAGAVPEPAAWAMLIGGFGMTGAAMRRRRKPVLAAA